MDTYTQHIKDNFFVDEFWTENEDGYFLLEETDKGGESQLRFKVQSLENLGILNIDKKNTLFNFLVDSKKIGLNTRVDHIVLEKRRIMNGGAHLVEMKSSISSIEKWYDIKKKFRSSYLFVQALCAMMHIQLTQIYMYTTYEKVNWSYQPENPSSRRLRVGKRPVSPEAEWNGGQFELRFGDECQIPFVHTPIHMERNDNRILIGEYDCM